ncbi:MAG TPA: hypothetical protein VFF64_18865 [Candidatus Eremiobacteraceae bacterium]|nr:hypothetical protein [Candidatus Eremiobacteraceae bacterium]
MHVHASQINPYAQLDSMYAAQKAAGRRAAAQTRRKLLEFASALAGEADLEGARVAGVAQRDQESHRNQQDQQRAEDVEKAA